MCSLSRTSTRGRQNHYPELLEHLACLVHCLIPDAEDRVDLSWKLWLQMFSDSKIQVPLIWGSTADAIFSWLGRIGGLLKCSRRLALAGRFAPTALQRLRVHAFSAWQNRGDRSSSCHLRASSGSRGPVELPNSTETPWCCPVSA